MWTVRDGLDVSRPADRHKGFLVVARRAAPGSDRRQGPRRVLSIAARGIRDCSIGHRSCPQYDQAA